MESEPKDVIVLGAIKSGAKKFDKICKVSKIEPEELNSILERLEERGLISVSEKKGLLGKKIEIIKMKRRKHHMKRMGHRQNFTEIKITEIAA